MGNKGKAKLGDRVRGLLEEKGITQAQFAESTGISGPMLSRLLNGERDVTMEHVVAWARVLGITPAGLVADTDTEDVLADWVPREDLDKCEVSRVDALEHAKALEVEVEMLRSSVAAAEEKARTLEKELANQQAAIVAAKAMEKEVAELRVQVPQLRGELALLTAKYNKLDADHKALTLVHDESQRQTLRARMQLFTAQNELKAAKSVAAVTTLGGAVALLALALKSDD